jgi:hypothetical protein
MTDIDPRKHVHGEAFMVMQYRSDDGTETEHIWNSRDGVTPFVVTLRSGKTASHVDWRSDVYCPNHFQHMGPGDRYFTDLDPEAALALASERVEEYWDHPEYPMKGRYESKDQAAQSLAASYMEGPGSPHLKEML